ncbi:hypothetical protein GMA8713_03270 [Grimontia marina]|uniref:Uncharacterized protein n=1 Tax=Grimontia marina TaxID=646534 RepID=A0A128FEV8_9GAMM|nr:hypothetical protein GMA8713_03270 [Grimontia marina]
MDWMIGKHYKLCDADWNVRFEGEITNVSELAM